jgi:hypothetical protein
MKVFISWSGESSNAIAKELRTLIGLVFPHITGWVSDTDISKGTYWPDELIDQLTKCNYAILCLTNENITNPWILFEAGFYAKIFKRSFICPYLLGFTQDKLISSPLALFQSAKADYGDTLGLLTAINEAYCSFYRSPGEETHITNEWIENNFKAHWPKFQRNMRKQLSKIKPKPETKEELLEAKMDAMVTIFKDLQSNSELMLDIIQKHHRD